jgi:hypothetical protein
MIFIAALSPAEQRRYLLSVLTHHLRKAELKPGTPAAMTQPGRHQRRTEENQHLQVHREYPLAASDAAKLRRITVGCASPEIPY